MKKKTRIEQLEKIFKNFELQERKEFRQTGIAIMSGASGLVILSSLTHERVTAFTADEIEGCFPFTSTCDELISKFDRLKEEDLQEEEHAVLHQKINTYILLLMSGVFAEMFYLIFDVEPNTVQTPRKTNPEDYFNYVYSQKVYDPIREKVNALRVLAGDPSIKAGERESVNNNQSPWGLMFAQLYRAEMDTVWARKTQLDAILALRELKKVPDALLLWLGNQNMQMEKEYKQGNFTNMYRKYDFKAFAVAVPAQ